MNAKQAKWIVALLGLLLEGCPLTVNVEQMDVYVTPEAVEQFMEETP